MKYSIIAIENIQNFTLASLSQSDSEYSTLYCKKNKKFYSIIARNQGRIIRPDWRRGARPAKKMRFLEKLVTLESRRIRNVDFKIILNSLKQVNVDYEPKYIYVVSDDTVNRLRIDKNNIQSSLQQLSSEKLLKYVLLLEDELKNKAFHKSSSVEKLKQLVKQELPRTVQFFRKGHSHSRKYLVSTDYQRMMFIYFLFCQQATFSLCLTKSQSQTKMKPALSNTKKVLVISNTSGSTLSYLTEDLEFYGSGLPGFHWKHLYGQITAERVESILAKTNFDLLIYRGHAKLQKGKIVWQLSDKDYALESFQCNLYIHLACLEKSDNLGLTYLPSSEALLPYGFLPDKNYRAQIECLLAEILQTADLYQSYQRTIEKHLAFGSWFQHWLG